MTHYDTWQQEFPGKLRNMVFMLDPKEVGALLALLEARLALWESAGAQCPLWSATARCFPWV